MLEQLESRRLLSVSVVNHVLHINGTNGANHIDVKYNAGDVITTITVLLNGKEDGSDSMIDVQSIFVDAGGGNDVIDFSNEFTSPATILGGNGRDHIVANSGSVVVGGAGNDHLFGTLDGRVTMYGGVGNDWLQIPGTSLKDVEPPPTPAQANSGGAAAGGRGNDTLTGGDGNDYCSGDAGHDLINGGSGDDRLVGGAGNDSLRSGLGTDTLIGNAGNDVLSSYSNTCVLLGGPGRDTLDPLVIFT